MADRQTLPRVLVVDDQPEMARTFSRAFMGHAEVTVEHSGRTALERFARGERFSLIVCDVMMPGMTGTQLFERVRALDPSASAAFVFVTGGASAEEQARVGATGRKCLSKPFTMVELLGLLPAGRR